MFADEYVNQRDKGDHKIDDFLLLGCSCSADWDVELVTTLQGRYGLDLSGRHGIQTRHEHGVEHVTKG